MSSKTKDKKQKTTKGKHTGNGAPKSVKKKDRKLNAKNGDRYDLYQRSVNSPETDVDFLTEVFEDLRGRLGQWMRATDDPLLKGPVPAPPGAKVNPVDGTSPREPVVPAS